MKKLMLLLSIAAMLAMPMTMDASAQSHRHTPRTSANVTVNNNGVKATATIADNDTTTGVVAYSDTTSAAAADTDTADNDYQYSYDSHDSDIQELKDVMDSLGTAVFLPVIIVSIVFIVAPAVIIFIICYFLYKNRQQKLKLAEMAMKNGQPIPDSILGYSTKKQGNKSGNFGNSGYSGKTSPSTGILASMPTDDQLWRKGVMHVFVGIGLMFLLDAMMGSFGFSIGVLVTLYGAGQAFIAWTSNRNANASEPVIEEPIVEEPIVEEPTADNPATDEASTEEPSKADTTDAMEVYPDDNNK